MDNVMSMMPTNEDINTAFAAGNGIEFGLFPDDSHDMHADLAVVGKYLGMLPVEGSFAWTDEQPIRRSVWVASTQNGEGFVTTEEELARTDGDMAAGQRGLEFLQQDEVVEPLTRLKWRADTALRISAMAIGIPESFLSQCGTRYRLIRYEGERAGIGVHFDGNGLSAVLTDGPGLFEIGYDGTVRDVDPNAISVMPGSSVHRSSIGGERPFLPTFHAVHLGRSDVKTSIAAFWNLPDKTQIPATLLGSKFDHDINAMKNDDGPNGSLRYLWEQVATAHNVSVEALQEGKIGPYAAK